MMLFKRLRAPALAVSLGLNLIGVAALVNVIIGRGGVVYLKAIVTHDRAANLDPGYTARQGLFERLPKPQDARPIVFLGDSLTAGCEWRELFGNRALILNRGIGGDTSAGVLDRAASIAELRPLAVFLMIGTNDRQLLGYSPERTIANYRAIIDRIRSGSPDTIILLESILPTRSPKFNSWSDAVNQAARAFADGRSVRYLDFRARFMAGGAIRPELTVDGIHLSGKGYLMWRVGIEETVAEFVAKQQAGGLHADESRLGPIGARR